MDVSGCLEMVGNDMVATWASGYGVAMAIMSTRATWTVGPTIAWLVACNCLDNNCLLVGCFVHGLATCDRANGVHS